MNEHNRLALPRSRPRISCSTGSLYHLPIATALGLIRDAGFDGAEFVVGAESLARGLPAVARIVARVGLPILTYHPPLYRFPGWPRPQIEGMLAVVAGAQALGSEVGIIHAPRGYSLATPRAQRYITGIKWARARAARHGIVIGLETTQKPWNGRPPMLFDDLAFFLQFAATYDVQVTLDTAHAAANHDDLLDVLAHIGPRLRNIHFSDCRFIPGQHRPLTHLAPGTGNSTDLRAFLHALAATHKTGVITLEVSPLELGLWPPRQIAQRLEAARQFIGAALDGL